MDKPRLIKFMRRIAFLHSISLYLSVKFLLFIPLIFIVFSFSYVVFMTISCMLPGFSETYDYILVDMRMILKYNKHLLYYSYYYYYYYYHHYLLFHIIIVYLTVSSCKSYLGQGRYNWRHDSVLNFIANTFSGLQSCSIYADLPAFLSVSYHW